MGLIIGSSLVAAFLAGIAALFAPCCITVLLPSFFASIFREKRKVFLMTFIFFLGILIVFLPLGMGMSALGKAFSKYHYIIFSVGGIFFVSLGLMLLSGKKIAMPFSFSPTIRRYNAISVFTLGIFSGIATTCCAPVLAGVLALSILPGSIFWGITYTLSYVLGMVLPLFAISIFMDKTDLTKKFIAASQSREIMIFGRLRKIKLADAISGITFIAMGVMTFVFARNSDTSASMLQISVNLFIAKLTQSLSRWLTMVPQYVWAVVVIMIFATIVRFAIVQFKEEKSEK